MIDIERTVRLLGEGCQAPLVVAAPYPLGSEACKRLINESLVGGVVADQREHGTHVFGWWKNRDRGQWVLSGRCNAAYMLFLGTRNQLSTKMLLAARLAGVKTIRHLTEVHDEIAELNVNTALIRGLKRSLRARLARTTSSHASLSYDDAFAQFYEEAGTRFRLPEAAFQMNRAQLILGSLGPGGAERQASLTARGIQQSGGWQVAVGCSNLQGNAGFFAPGLREIGVEVLEIPVTPPELEEEADYEQLRVWSFGFQHLGFQNIVHTILSYVAFLRRYPPGLVHTWMDYSNVLAGIAADLVGVPSLVLSGRSMAPHHFEIFQPYMEAGYRALLARKPATILNNSRAGALDYASWLGLSEDRIRVVPNGFQPPAVAEPLDVRNHYGLPQDAPIVGGIIRFSEEKQPYLWLETATRIVKTVPNCRFVLIGDGVMYEDCRQWVKAQGLEEVIVLPGLELKAQELVAGFDVFLLTSRMEGLPNVLIEAQSAGVPVVTTGFGGMQECYVEGVTGRTGKDVDELASHAVFFLKGLNDTQSVADMAAEFVAETFSVENMLTKTQDAYRQAQGNGGTS